MNYLEWLAVKPLVCISRFIIAKRLTTASASTNGAQKLIN